ncbi:fluoride efflux transporter FluC, partial [Thiolapillus sp.]
YVLLLDRLTSGPELRAFLLIGFLGAFTTFSTFSIETFNLIEEVQISKALLNAGGSVVVCVAAAWLGVILGRQL